MFLLMLRHLCTSTVSDIKAIESEICYSLYSEILNMRNDAPFFICIHYLTDVKLQICYYVFKCITGYYDVSWYNNNIEVFSNSSLISDNVGPVLRMEKLLK